MKSKLCILGIIITISCDSLLFEDSELDNNSDFNYYPGLVNTINDPLYDIGSVNEYFYNFTDSIDAQYYQYTAIHLAGGVHFPDSDTLNFKTYPDFFVITTPETSQDTLDLLTETIFDTTYVDTSIKELSFEINESVSRIDSLVWEQVSGSEYRYVPYTTRLEKLTEEWKLDVYDEFDNIFHQSIIDPSLVGSNYIIIDTLEWDTTETFTYIDINDTLLVGNGDDTIESLENNTNIAYEFIIDTMAVYGEDSLMFVDSDGTIGDKLDSLLISYIDEPFDDLNNNGQYDPDAEPYEDTNENGQYDPAEEFIDCNGINCDGTLCEGDDGWDDSMGNGEYDTGEEFTDMDGNNEYDGPTALFDPSSLDDCICSDAEVAIFSCLQGEDFVDENGDGVFDPPESFTDVNGNGMYDSAEPYTDSNGNGSYDFAETFEDLNGNGDLDTSVDTELTRIYPGDYLITEAGDSSLLIKIIYDYSYYKTLNYENIESIYQSVNSHIILEDTSDISEYKVSKTQFNWFNQANGLTEHEYDYHLFKIEDHIKKFMYPSYFNYYGLWEITEDNEYGFFTPDTQNGFWFEDYSIDDILFYLNSGQYFRDGEHVQTFQIDSTDHAIYFITKDYIVERDTVTVPYQNGVWDTGYCLLAGYPDYGISQESCIQGGYLWIQAEDFSDENPNGAYDDCEDFSDENPNGVYDDCEDFSDNNNNGQWDEGEEFTDLGNCEWDGGEEFTDLGNCEWDESEDFIDENTLIPKSNCFKITRTLEMQMQGTGITYREMGISWLVKDLYIVKDEVYFAWGSDEWTPYSRIILSEFRKNSQSSPLGRNGLFGNLIGGINKIKLSEFEEYPDFDNEPFKKTRTVGIQRIGISH